MLNHQSLFHNDKMLLQLILNFRFFCTRNLISITKPHLKKIQTFMLFFKRSLVEWIRCLIRGPRLKCQKPSESTEGRRFFLNTFFQIMKIFCPKMEISSNYGYIPKEVMPGIFP